MNPTHCSQCGTALMEAPILYEVIIGEELFQIEDVPALVCRECGEEWIEQEVRDNIERMIQEGAEHN
jgi:uncharacterized Zn ribbon protein